MAGDEKMAFQRFHQPLRRATDQRVEHCAAFLTADDRQVDIVIVDEVA